MEIGDEKDNQLPENTNDNNRDCNNDEAKTDTKQDHDKENASKESSPALDFSKISDEIDQYIYDLSIPNASTKDQEKGNHKIIEQYVTFVEKHISTYDSSESTIKWSQMTMKEECLFLDTVERISKLLILLNQFSACSLLINQLGSLLQRSLSYLEDEFRSILEDYNESKESDQQNTDESSSPKINFRGYSDSNVSKLKTMIKVLMLDGYDMECYQIYFLTRRNAIQESLNKLGLEKYSIDDLQKMSWESLAKDIVTWIKLFKEFVTNLFPMERSLIDTLFTNYKSTSERLCDNLLQGVIIHFLNYAEAVSMTKRSSEKLFKLLNVYETLQDQITALNGMCSAKKLDELMHESVLTRNRLGESMIYIFTELESLIKADTVKTPTPGGAVHPLTSYTMNYLINAYDYKEILDQVFEEQSKNDNTKQVENNSNESRFQTKLGNVIDLLEKNLENKSALYKDQSLSSIFMMNNGRYIMKKIKSCKMMEETWCRKRSKDLMNYHKNYQRETWGKLLQSLNPDGLTVRGKVSKPVLKERFKSFNSIFDDISKTQSSWVVSDEQLQTELRVSISAVITPAYRSFIGRFSQVFTRGRQVQKYIKYQPEDVEASIQNLFDGSAGVVGNSSGKFW